MNEKNELPTLENKLIDQAKPHKKRKRKLSWNNTTVTAVLLVVALISIAQTVQSAEVLKKIEGGGVSPASASGATLPDNLNNLPNMVGGC